MVYIRRSDTTGQADPDEVARMAMYDSGLIKNEPNLTIEFADLQVTELLGSTASFDTERIISPNIDQIPTYNKGTNSIYRDIQPNKNYYRDVAKFLSETNHLKKVRIGVQNVGEVLASNVRIRIAIEKSKEVTVMEEHHLEETPSPTTDFFSNLHTVTAFKESGVLESMENSESWTFETIFGNIQPGATVCTRESIAVGSGVSQSISLEVVLFADNLARPICQNLTLEFNTRAIELETDKLLDLCNSWIRG